MTASHVSFLATLLGFFLALFTLTEARPSKRDTLPNEIRATLPNLSAYSPVLTDGESLPNPFSNANSNNIRRFIPPRPNRNPQVHHPRPRHPKLHLRLLRQHPHLHRCHRSTLQRSSTPPSNVRQPRSSHPKRAANRSDRRNRCSNPAVRLSGDRRTPLHRHRRADLGPLRRWATVRVLRGRYTRSVGGECGTAGVRGCGLEGVDECGGERGVE